MKQNGANSKMELESKKNAARMAWTAPTVEELPKLTELTLLTGAGIPGGGGTGGGGSTVF